MSISNKASRNKSAKAKAASEINFSDIINNGSSQSVSSVDDNSKNLSPSLDRSDKYKAIGMILREARESKGINLEDISSNSKVRLEHLQMTEDGMYEEVSQLTYYYGCVRVIAVSVGLDPDIILLEIISDDPNLIYVLESCKKVSSDDKKSNTNQKVAIARRRDSIKRDMISLFVIVGILLLIVGWARGDNSGDVGSKFLKDIEVAATPKYGI